MSIKKLRKYFRLLGFLDFNYQYLKNKPPSRLALIKAAFKNKSTIPLNSPKKFLLEYNANKLKAAERVFDVKLIMLNPFNISYSIIFSSLLLLIVPLGKKNREIFFCLIARYNIDCLLPEGSTLYFFNPYACIHWAFSGHSMAHRTYIHTHGYPLFDSTFYTCNKTIRDIYSIPVSNCQIVKPLHQFCNQSSRTIRFYFTKLSRISPVEKYLKTLAEYAIKKSQYDSQIYLHYLDSTLYSPFDKDFLNDCIVNKKSLFNLCHKQISISGSSSVGFEISALIDEHFILYNPIQIKPWQKNMVNHSNFISIDCPVSEVYDSLFS